MDFAEVVVKVIMFFKLGVCLSSVPKNCPDMFERGERKSHKTQELTANSVPSFIVSSSSEQDFRHENESLQNKHTKLSTPASKQLTGGIQTPTDWAARCRGVSILIVLMSTSAP